MFFFKKYLLVLVLGFTGASQAALLTKDVLLVVGDSLSAGYGISPDNTWVSLLSKRFSELDYPFVIVNKSVSGATTQNGVDRLPQWLAELHPKQVIVALGSNDGLRGISVLSTKKNIENMIVLSQKEGAKVILIGFMVPPNYGPDYANTFKNVFPALAEKHELTFVPFLLEGIAEDRKYFQADGFHPNEAGQQVMFENVWKILEKN